ncbi:MAG: choline/ethanolamine kinase family protein, partial [Bacillota bacterium]|nr:choline/ethanolamine kinase family protein [Bacillota bacterium]
MKPRIDKEFINEICPEERPEIERLALLMCTASQEEIVSAEVMGGGLTNRNFKVELSNGTKVAVRIAGKGTQEYMNRPAEKHNATLMSSLGINAEIYYFDTRTGSQLSQFLEGRTLHPEDFRNDPEILKKTAAIMT